MKTKRLNYKQAVASALKYQSLVGHPFSREDNETERVKQVLVVPYNPILRWSYLSNVLSGVDPNRAITICKDGKYAVVLLSDHYRPHLESTPPKFLQDYLSEFESALVAVC